jgi:hypothetical protein
MPVVGGKALGRKRPLFEDFSVPLPPRGAGDDAITLRDLIDSVVRGEVAAFHRRQDERRLLHALTAREIDEGAVRGKIAAGASEVEPQSVDVESAVAVALQAYEDGLYLVVIDGAQPESLDSEVFVRPDSRITFIRLTLLAGG